MKTFFNSPKNIFWALSATLLVSMIIMSQSAGISGDEHVNYNHAEFVYNYYKTFGEDTTALNTPKTMLKYYGQSFDNTTYIINKWFNIDNYYESRHLLNSVSGWVLILFTGLTAALIFGWQTGILALFIMFFSPLIIGHSWNNPKDIPFAATYTFALYFLTRLLTELPKRKIKTLLYLSLGIAASISIRIGGLILIPYIFMFCALYYLTKKSFYTKSGFFNALKTIPFLLGVSAIGYALGLLFWPYALEDPLKNPINALQEMTNFEVGLNQLFEGKIIMSKEFPWYYGVKYLLLKTPLSIIIGAVIFVFTFVFRTELKKKYLLYSLMLFAFAFPIAYTIYKDSNLYGGCRHLIWTISPVVILAAGGFDFFTGNRNRYIKYTGITLFCILLIHPAIHTFKNHPYQYIYYNQISGGVKGAFGNYEMDYYYHSLKEGADYIKANELTEDTINIITNHNSSVQYFFRNNPNVNVHYSRFYEKSKKDWDYAIWANTHISPIQLTENYWPPKEAIYTMEVDGMPVGAVIKRISKHDLKGFQALKKNNLEEAKTQFNNFLSLYPESEEVLEAYARIMLRERKYDSTLIIANRSLQYNPRQYGALLLKTSALNTKKNYKEALQTSNEMIAIKDDYADAHFQKGYALKNLNNPNEALKEFQQAAVYKKDNHAALMQMAEIMVNHKQYDKAIKFYNDILKFKPEDIFCQANIAKCHHLKKQNDKAEELIKKIPARNQNHFEVVKTKCRIAMSKNDMQSSARYINMARNINNNADMFVIRTLYALKHNNKAMAKTTVNKAIELDPINKEAQELLKLVQGQNKPVATQTQQSAQKPTQQQSIMFQKPKPKQTSPIKVPTK